MSSATYIARLRREFRDLKKNPVNNIQATPKENNILEWHYVIEGLKGSPYQDGWYHGVVTFPKEYPFKPPSIQMITPNGRFKVTFTIRRITMLFVVFKVSDWAYNITMSHSDE